MKLGMSLKIDTNKIDKSRIFKGEKGNYLDLVVFIDTEQKSQYGDHGTVKQSTTKEERESGAQTPILGNVKVFFTKESDKSPKSNAGFDDTDIDEEEIPF